MPNIQKLTDVVDWRLCLGCGACAYICPKDLVQLADFSAEGIRPVVNSHACANCRQCLDTCPAVKSDLHSSDLPSNGQSNGSFRKKWGAVLGMWEGYASDPAIRFKGASGGVLTAIAAYCLEKLDMHGVLHIAQDPVDPVRNRTRLSRSRMELIESTGSRYSPASVCNGLSLVERAPAPCVIIGKPFEIAAVWNARKLRTELDRNVGVTLSFFCAESPSTRGTLALLEKLGIEGACVRNLRYRGHGWPGHFAVQTHAESELHQKMSYPKSWNFLQAFRPWSVQLWPDGTGELADISCGDPWYKEPDGINPGFSLVLARTEQGREIIEGSMAAGYLSLKPAENWKLEKSQAGLLEKKGGIWGRRLALKLFGLPVADCNTLDLWHCWLQLPVTDMIRSILGTIRRIVTRKLYRPIKLDHTDSLPVKPPIILA